MTVAVKWSRDFDIEWNTYRGSIVLRSNWFYEWAVWPGVQFTWSASDKSLVHTTFERQIMSAWSQRLKFKVQGNGAFAKKFAKSGLTLDFDVVRTSEGRRHWNVRVWKLPPNAPETSSTYNDAWPMVKAARRYIILNDKSLYRTGPVTTAHEFGHVIYAPDEYWRSSPFVNDVGSLMNLGRDIHGRHLILLEGYLQALTRAQFSDPSIQLRIARR